MLQRDDPRLLSWFARFCEARGALATALHCYQRTGDHLAMCRVHCAAGAWAAAEQLVASTRDAGAAGHLARLYEAQGRPEDAARCYAAAGRFSQAARVARAHGLRRELLAAALQAPAAVALDAADHLLAEGDAEGAALLYRRGGRPERALAAARAAGLDAVVDDIAAALAAGELDGGGGDGGDGSGNDPALRRRAADALLAAGQHERAAQVYARAGDAASALDLVERGGVPLSDELADALAPPLSHASSSAGAGGLGADDADARRALLLRVARAAKRQGRWPLAARKFTQAGDRVRAMRALVRAGDAEKVALYASECKCTASCASFGSLPLFPWFPLTIQATTNIDPPATLHHQQKQ